MNPEQQNPPPISHPYQPPLAAFDAGPAAAVPSRFLAVRCWLGEARLWQAFWIMTFGINTLLQFGVPPVAAILLAQDASPALVDGLVFLLALVHTGYATVSLWRCAPNSSHVFFKVLGRVLAVALLLYAVKAVHEGIVADADPAMPEPAPVRSVSA